MKPYMLLILIIPVIGLIISLIVSKKRQRNIQKLLKRYISTFNTACD